MDKGEYAALVARAAALSYAAEQLDRCAQEARAEQVFDGMESVYGSARQQAYAELEGIAAELKRRALEIEQVL